MCVFFLCSVEGWTNSKSAATNYNGEDKHFHLQSFRTRPRVFLDIFYMKSVIMWLSRGQDAALGRKICESTGFGSARRNT